MADDLRARVAEAIDQRLNRLPGLIATPSVSDLLADAVLAVVRAELLAIAEKEDDRLRAVRRYAAAGLVTEVDAWTPFGKYVRAIADRIAPERTTDG